MIYTDEQIKLMSEDMRINNYHVYKYITELQQENSELISALADVIMPSDEIENTDYLIG